MTDSARNLKILEFDKIAEKLSSLAHTAPGRQMCLSLEPSSSESVVKARLNETDDALKVILSRSEPPLSGFDDISAAVIRSRSGALLSCGELLQIGRFLRAVSRLIGFLPENDFNHQNDENIIYLSIRELIPFTRIEKRISEAIAGEDELYDTASQELAVIRRKIREAQSEVRAQLDRILRSFKESLQDQIVTMRGNRYVIPVRADRRGDIKGIVHDTSSSGATLFVEPLAVIEINNKVRELMSDEREEIERILAELSGIVREVADELIFDLNKVTNVDFINAKGSLAYSMRAIRPNLNNKGLIELKNARHPLISADKVVPVTITIGDQYRTLVITGPNTGGKTVSLKTCGLLTLMTMSGLMIPVSDGSSVSVFNDIFADIGDEQSIEQSLSTFSSHMSKLVRMVKEAKPSTLMLVDELGSGTDPSEGAALAVAILEHFKDRGCITVATTHYKELKEYALITDGVENACCEFDVTTLRPTYRLMIGVPGVSNAFAISSKLGLPEFIIERASTLISGKDIQFEKIAAQTEKTLKDAQFLKSEAERELLEAKAVAEKAKRDSDEIEARKKKVFMESREKAREYADSIYEELQDLIKEARDKARNRDTEETRSLLEEARTKVRTRRNRINDEIGNETIKSFDIGSPPEDLEIGKEYYSAGIGIKGVLQEYSRGKAVCIIRSGNRTLSVPVASLRDVTSVNTDRNLNFQAGRRLNGFDGLSKKMNATTELKLLGFTVDEALMSLDKFIDESIMAGIATIRIVHGKGTGALRNAVDLALRKDKRIKSFRLASYGEGDSGVTIADL